MGVTRSAGIDEMLVTILPTWHSLSRTFSKINNS